MTVFVPVVSSVSRAPTTPRLFALNTRRKWVYKSPAASAPVESHLAVKRRTCVPFVTALETLTATRSLLLRGAPPASSEATGTTTTTQASEPETRSGSKRRARSSIGSAPTVLPPATNVADDSEAVTEPVALL